MRVIRHLLVLLASIATVLWCGGARAEYYTPSTGASVASAYPWIDITATGTTVSLNNDAVSANINLGFTFSFGGTSYTQVRIQSNGMLQFSGTDTEYLSSTLPLTGAGTEPDLDRVMLPLWDDFNPNGTTTIRYRSQGTAPNRVFIVSWNAVPYYCSGGSNCTSNRTTTLSATFQVQIYEQGYFVYRYGTVDGSGGAHTAGPTLRNSAGATVGFEVSDTDYIQYSYRTASVPSGTTILWSRTSTPELEYLFEESSWGGTSGEVQDTSVNGYDGTAASLTTAEPTTANASPAVGTTVGTCRYGVFTRSRKDYVALPAAFPDFGATSFTITAWIRTTDNTQAGQRILVDDENNTAGYGFSVADGATGTLRFFSRGAASALTTDTGNVIANNTWYFVAAVLDTTNSTKRVYVYNTAGTQLAAVSGTYSETSFGSDTGRASVGGETNAAGEGNNAFGFSGNIDELRVYKTALSTTELATVRQLTHSCAGTLHHVEVRHATGTGLTCTPSTLTLVACQDAACTVPYTGGVTGTLSATGTPTVNWVSGSASFTIPAGSSSVTKDVQVTTPGSVVFGAATGAMSPTPTNATTCNFGSPSCTFTAADSGFVFDVPDHVSETAQSINVSAVQASATANTCVPAFASTSKSVTFRCSYANPTTGYVPVRVTSGATTSALNASNSAAAACDGTGRAVTLNFDATGVAPVTVRYADVGQMTLSAAYTGSGGSEAGLSMTGSDTFIAAPSTFAVAASLISPATRYVAGSPFRVQVTARNSAGGTAANFGRETSPVAPTLTFTRTAPTGAGTSDGSFSPASITGFGSGVATTTAASWSEVGLGDLAASVTGYLGSALNATGSTTGVGPFVPHHFTYVQTATSACTVGTTPFTYSGQPLSIRLEARNAGDVKTVNYTGAYAKTTTLSAYSGGSAVASGSFTSGGTIASTSFTNGDSGALAPVFTFTSKLTAPVATMAVRATDTDGVSTATAAGGNEDAAGKTTAMRSGRLRLSNAFGSEKTTLTMPVTAQYWTGSSWVTNGDDRCTTVPTTAVVRMNYLDNKGASTAAWTTTATASITIGQPLLPTPVAAGTGSLVLSAPSPTATGSVDIALNLGTTATDASCLSGTHPATTGAGLAWLRSQNGSCAATYDRDPSARATFGIYAPESRKTVHTRELY